MLDRRHTQAFLLLGLVMVLWAGNSIVARAVRFDVPPFTLAFLRWSGATLAVAPFALRPLRRDWPAIRRGWRPLLFLGLMGIGAFNALLYSGLQYTTATNALLLQAAIPAAMVLFDRLFFGVRSSGWQIVGVSASMLGVAAIVFQGDPAALLRLRFGFGAALLYVALLPSLLSYFIYNHATGIVGPANAGQAITLMPLFGAVIAAVLLGERLHGFHFAGMAFILAGIALSLFSARRQQPAGAAKSAGLEGEP